MATPTRKESSSKLEPPMRSGYSTFKDMPLHECLFELSTYLMRTRDWSRFYFCLNIAATLLWPIGWLVAVVAGYIGHQQSSKPLQMIGVYFLIANIAGLIMSGPSLPLFLWRGHAAFREQVSSNQISVIDVLYVWLDVMVVLMSVMFCMLYSDICHNVGQFKKRGRKFLEAKVELEPDAFDSNNKLLIKDSKVLAHLFQKREGRVPIDGDPMEHQVDTLAVLDMLEEMPGWPQGLDSLLGEGDDDGSVQERLYPQSARTGFFRGLEKCVSDAEKKGIISVDAYMIKADELEGHSFEEEPFWKMLLMKMDVVRHQAEEVFMLCLGRLHPRTHYFRLSYVIAVALLRSLLPRLWVGFYFGESFLPRDIGFSAMVIWSSIATFCATFVWFAIFFVMQIEYKNNVNQAMIISALIDPRMRMRYVEEVLAKDRSKDMDERKKFISRMPLLNLRAPENVAGFWRIREYGVIDRSNERIAMETLMDALLFWCSINFVLALIDLFKGASFLSALAPAFLFDFVVYGSLGLSALSSALTVNKFMEEHKRIFVECRYDTVRAEIKLEQGNTRRESFNLDSRIDVKDNFKKSQSLIKQYILMMQEVDVRETILLGLDVTPLRIIGTLLTVTVATSTLIGKMYEMNRQSGQPGHQQFMGHAAQVVSAAAVTVVETVIHNKAPGRPAW